MQSNSSLGQEKDMVDSCLLAYGMLHSYVDGQCHSFFRQLQGDREGFDETYKSYIHSQIIELLMRYGRIDVLWFDGGSEAISFDEIRELQPGVVVNPRMHGYGDFQTPGCQMPDAEISGWWELCDIWPNGCWGYDKRHESYKPTGWMLSRLTKCRGWGGNYLVNVSPRPSGDMPDAYYQKLGEVKEWMEHSGESIFGIQPGPYPEQSSVPVTVRDRRWYLHVNLESQDLVVLIGVSEPGSVKLLRTGTGLEHKLTNGQLVITIPPELRTDSVDVVSVHW